MRTLPDRHVLDCPSGTGVQYSWLSVNDRLRPDQPLAIAGGPIVEGSTHRTLPCLTSLGPPLPPPRRPAPQARDKICHQE
jgi:hypothetical protein